MSRIAVLILAAGNSSRLGRPKQLLPYRGRTLVTHAVREALAAGLGPVVVVTGAYRAEVEAALEGEPVQLIYNPNWETGMGSGIVAGVSLLRSNVDAIILAVCDQPFISFSLLLKLAAAFETSGKGIVASAYADSVGTPALFGAVYFDRLLSLAGGEGAKKLLRQHADDVATVDFPQGHIDIDTIDDLANLG